MFTVADNLAWLLLEQALRERFIAFYDGIIPLVNNNGEEHPLIAPNFDVVAEAFRRGDYRKGSWGLQISSGDTMKFRASLSQLQDWARREHLLDGQRNKTLFDPIFLDRRNSVAHSYCHLLVSFDDSACTIREIAEIINRLGGHYTPGGRLYPAPLKREIFILGWIEEVGKRIKYNLSLSFSQLTTFDEPADWQCIII